MKKNESKPKKATAVATDAPAVEKETTAAAEQPAKAEEPAETTESEVKDDPAETTESEVKDDPAAVPVTFLVMLTSEDNDCFLLRHCLRSLEKYIRGVNATVKVVGKEKPKWLDKSSWLDVSDATDTQNWNSLIIRAASLVEDERIVIMSDRMSLLHPVNIADIALLKAEVGANGNQTVQLISDWQGSKVKVHNYKTNMPAMFFKSSLIEILDFVVGSKGVVDFDLPTAYFNLLYADLTPLLLEWSTDSWLLPIVSENPNMDRVRTYWMKKKFLYISDRYGKDIIAWLKFMTPDPSKAEKLLGNEDPAED